MKKNLTEMVFILDRSGSMGGLESDTIGGFNSMLNKQKQEDGEAFVTTVLFDHELLTLHDRLPVDKVPEMTASDYTVRGCTALLDAVGGTIEHIEQIHRYIRETDVPEHVMFVITTDGLENASKRFSTNDVKKLIEKKKQLGWEFIFLGANIDAVGTAANIGIDENRAVNYHADSKGTGVIYDAVSRAVSKMRACAPIGNAWREEVDEDFNSRR